MKKISLILCLLLTGALAMTACGHDTEEGASESSVASDIETSLAESEETQQETEETSSDIQVFRQEFNDSARPVAVAAELSTVCEEDISSLVRLENLYNIHALHTGVVGLVGVPVEVSYPEDKLSDTRLTFYYDKEQLRGVPESNLIVLHYNENGYGYDEIMAFSLDAEEQSLSLNIYEPGVYMLCDAYEWFKVWGDDRYRKYAYEVDASDYATDWELECDTGSIMDIADVEWAMENAPNFSVSTPEQLAGVVYYVNGINEDNDYVFVTLENNIDLSGYEWVPMGWDGGYSHAFSGLFNGKDHTIRNMTIASGYSDAGFIGYCNDAVVGRITFENASVSGSSCTGIVGGQVYMSNLWEEIHLINCTVNGGYSDSGTIIGRETGTGFKNCSVHHVKVNNEISEYFSYRQKVIAETEVTETFTLTMDENYIISRDSQPGFDDLGWYFETDGVVKLHRNAEGETEYDAAWIMSEPGKHRAYLVSFIGETYIRVSNIIEVEN